MGKKKKQVEVFRPWCYYCGREFEDEKILVQHQKAKHFKCHVCHKKLSTASGMVIHVLQVHKENVTRVPNSKPGRDSTDLEIFGMNGIPQDVLDAGPDRQGGGEDDSNKVAKVGLDQTPRQAAPLPASYPPPVPFAPAPYGMPPYGMQPYGQAHYQPAYPAYPPPYGAPPYGAPNGQAAYPPPIPGQPGGQPPRPLFPIGGVRPPSAPVGPDFRPIGTPGTPGTPGSAPAHTPPLPSASPAVAGSPAVPGTYAVGSDGALPTATPTPPQQGTAQPPAAAPGTNEVYLVWDDEDYSMEERRAMLSKYAVEDEVNKAINMDAAIERRLQAFAGGTLRL
eukprot:jgi/Chlat1/3738/Chrsp259S03897